MRIERFGQLSARVTGGNDGRGGGDGPLVMLLHGYGAPGDDLVALGRYLRAPHDVRFVFPEAPLAVDYGGRAWWPLDMELFERRARGERVDRSDDVPDTLPTVRAQLLEHIDDVSKRLAVAPDRMLLGGFSQGSMLACDVALHSAVKPAGLILMSSTLIARSEWEPRMASCKSMPVVQTHGKRDPLLEFEAAEKLRDLLRDNGADVNFISFDGGHEIPPVALEAIQHFVREHTGA